jgi:diguanylate cyclase (GGDEF)-like protein
VNRIVENPVTSTQLLDLARLPCSADLPSLPAVALEIVRVCQDPDADVDALAAVLSRDPTMAGKVLRLANSAAYNRGLEITSLQRASMMLGLRALKVLALGFTLAGELPSRGSSGGFDLRLYWHRSLVNAVVARALCLAIGLRRGEEAFLAGLLSHIGKLALAQGTPEAYAGVVTAAGPWPAEEAEHELLGFSSAEAGEALLRSWGLPELIVLGASYPARLAALPEDASPEARELATVTSLALLAAAVFFDEDRGAALRRFSAEAKRHYGLHDEDLDAIVARVETDVRETAEVLSLELPPGVSYQAILEDARLQMVAVSLDAVLGFEQTLKTVDELSREKEELEHRASTDALTGLPNRAALDAFLARQVELRLRGPLPEALGVVMIDVDRFKRFNDTYGHAAGDAALRAVAEAMRAVVRETDLLARYGGEEFCLVAPQTSPGALRVLCERLRRAVAAQAIDLGDAVVGVTASFGGACRGRVESAADGSALLALADAWLYRAKERGRNRVEVLAEL